MTFCNSKPLPESPGLANLRRARAILDNVAGAHGATYDSSKVTNIFAGTTFNPAATAPTVTPDFVVDTNRTIAGNMSSIGLQMEMLISRTRTDKRNITEELCVLSELGNTMTQAAKEVKTIEVFRRIITEARDICDQLLSATGGAK